MFRNRNRGLLAWMRRLAVSLSPPAEKRWIEALFSELRVIEEPFERALWLIGVVNVVGVGMRTRCAQLFSSRMNLVAVAACSVALLSGGASVIGYEGSEFLDQVFLALALAWGAISCVLTPLVVGRLWMRRRNSISTAARSG